jgi:hypothetical protein
MITACDNLEALRKSTVERTKVKTTWKSVELISQILDVWSKQHCTQLPQHVYGHQDDKHMGPLTFVEQLNISMDTLAKMLATRSFGRIAPIPAAVPLIGMGQVMVKGSLVVSTFQKSLAYGIHHSDIVEYLANEWEIDTNLLHESVAWPSIAKLTNVPPSHFNASFQSGSVKILLQVLRCVVESNEFTIIALDATPQKSI